MKTLIIAISALLLSACSAFQARTYDAVEYNYAVNIAANATHAIHRCINMVDPDYDAYLQALNHDSLTLVEFVGDKSDTAQSLPAVKQIRDMIQDFLSQHNYSVKYCEHKLSNIQASSRTFARATSGNSNYDMCQSDVQSRFDMFNDSYKHDLISKDEFANLTSDLLRLKTIDTSGCTLEERAKMAKALAVIQTAAQLGGL